jgi:hypothetical protein
MPRTPRSLLLVPLAGALALWAAGCYSGPSYPKAQLKESLQQVMEEDGLQPTVRYIDRTIAVHVPYVGALTQASNQIGLGPNFDEASRKILTALHRVLLSTDAPIDFYVVLLSDPEIPGAYLTMVRYIDDIKRANANMLDVPEMFARTIFELNYVGNDLPVSIEQYVPRDIRLEEFLSWQLARRIQAALSEDLRTTGMAAVGRCGGRFQDGEFAFTLDVVPTSGAALDDAMLEQVFNVSTNVVAKVLESYEFESFDQVRLIHPLTGRNVVLPKTRLDVFR